MKGVVLVLFSLIIIFGLSTSWIVGSSTKNELFNSIKDIPYNEVGLVLGTAKFLSDGRINLYYKYRIEAAYLLFASKKVDFLLISGDNSTEYYDEPTTMMLDLKQMGVPEEKMYLDFAGFRTLDSVVRSKEVFGQNSITVVSQKFHNERAIYIAKRNDIDAVGFNAQEVNGTLGRKVKIRERLARVKLFIDLIFDVSPKFLGQKIEIV